MLYLPRKLRRFIEDYFDEHGIEYGRQKHRFYVDVIREWAKQHGFTCQHKFDEDSGYFVIKGVEYKRCIWCGEPVPRQVAERISGVDYTRLYPKLDDLR
jgi:hypothetical protein